MPSPPLSWVSRPIVVGHKDLPTNKIGRYLLSCRQTELCDVLCPWGIASLMVLFSDKRFSFLPNFDLLLPLPLLISLPSLNLLYPNKSKLVSEDLPTSRDFSGRLPTTLAKTYLVSVSGKPLAARDSLADESRGEWTSPCPPQSHTHEVAPQEPCRWR